MSVEEIFNNFPVLDAGDYILRNFTYSDIEDYFSYISNDDVNRYIPEECIPRSIEQTKREIEYNMDLFNYRRSIYWAVTRKSDNKLIGSCGFNYWNRDHSRTEISYDLAREYWGMGIMTNVVKSVLAFGFTRMELHRVEATVTPTNKGSLRILQKIGFKKEGVLREQKLLHGKFHDAIILSILQKEYLKF